MKIFNIRHIGRLPPNLSRKLMNYYAKRLAGWKVTPEEWGLKHYFYTLIESGGRFESEEENAYYTKLTVADNLPVCLCSRKGPSSDVSVLNQIFAKREYEAVTYEMLKYVPKDFKVNMLDAGANIGYAAVYFKSVFPNAKIVCVEPEDSNFVQLQKNISLNGFNIDVDLMKAGLWSREAYLKVKKDAFRDQAEWSFHVIETTEEEKELKGYSVTDIMRRMNWHTIDLLKIDIEGAETAIFEDDRDASSFLSRTRFLVIEIHDEFKIRNRIYEILRANQFVFFESGDLTIARNTKELP